MSRFSSSSHIGSFMTVPVVAALALTACGTSSDPAESTESSPEPTATTAATQSQSEEPVTEDEGEDSEGSGSELPDTAADDELEEAGEDEDIAEALEERDQFFEDQQLPLDGSPLEATTPEQKEFIDAQRAHIESYGMTWTPQEESATLALTADACETAILAFHDVDASDVQMHIMSSPLIEAHITDDMSEEEQEEAEANLASVMVSGMGYMCPDDAPQWEDAFDELYPDYWADRLVQ